MIIALKEQPNSSEFAVMAAFARMDALAMSIAIASVCALGMALATAVLLIKGAPEGVPIGGNLSTLRNIFPGYSVTWPGILIGAAWAGLTGAIAGFLIATTWNFAHIVFLGFLALDYPRRATALETERVEALASENRELFSAAVRLNVVITAISAALALGLALFLAAYISLKVAEHPGHYLNLLGIFMPGYSVTSRGVWLGLLWGAIYGGIVGGAIAWLYARSLGTKLSDLVIWDETASRGLRPPVLRISTHALGIAIGIVAAVQLMLATLWLVIRGTADESMHAKLLSHYLPGYTVSVSGSLLGGVELFLFVYLFTMLVGTIYNTIAFRREGRER